VNCIDQTHGPDWSLYHGDVCDVIKGMPDGCMDFSIYSPPFTSVFVYSDSERDMGNCQTDEEFFQHYAFLLPEILRITRPGRLTAVHCSDLPQHKYKDGAVGLKDFPGQIIAAHQAAGWIYHSRVVIWKDPVLEMQRTKALGLLHKQVKKDSCMVRVARSDKDGRHLCPLQLDVIERAVQLWTLPGDTVFTPFCGIGSEVYGAVNQGRKGVGVELKPEYYRTAVANMKSTGTKQLSLMEAMA